MNPNDIDRAKIAVLASGERILVYSGEGAGPDCFAGEKLDPTDQELRMNAHVSCFWLRSKVVALEGLDANPHPERTA